MNSTAQGLATNPLLGSTKPPLSSTAKGADKPSIDSANSLNNKDFSDVLDDQKTLSKGSEKKSGSQPLEQVVESKDVEDQQSVLTFTEAPATPFADSGGKSLPIEGYLPPSTAIAVDAAEGKELIASSATKSDNLGQTVALESGKGKENFILGNRQAESSDAITRGGLSHSSVIADTTKVGTRSNGSNFGGSGQSISATTAIVENSSNPIATDVGSVARSINGAAINTATVNFNGQNVGSHWTPGNTAHSFMMQGQAVSDQSVVGAFGSLNGQFSETGLVNKLASGQTVVEGSAFNSVLTTALTPGIQNSIQASFQASTPVDVGKPGWGETVMQRVMWMSSQNINKAEIALDPLELGPLQVKISTQGDQTSVVFSSHHSSVREALDQGLYRLREMMEEQGLDLADVDVSDQSSYQQQAESEQGGTGGENEGEQAMAEQRADGQPVDSPQKTSVVASSLALVDQYV